jgi:putative ABC transport system permease protein
VYVNFELEPYTRVHLYSAYDGFEPNSNIKYVYIISAIAILILVIACFTYINLSTARSMERAREVGIRKVAGAVRGQVFWQFITESLLIALVALVLSVLAATLVLPAFNQLTERTLDWKGFIKPEVIATCIGIVLTISLLAGSYPALVLSNFQPIKVLKGVFKNSGSGAALRKSLIVFQFMISVFLIIATFVIQKQMQYIQNKNLGFNRENVIILDADQKIIEKYPTIREEFRANPDILSVSKSYESPVTIRGGYSVFRNDQTENQAINCTGNPVDEEYVPANQLEIIGGSNFTKQDVKDASNEDYEKNINHFIINESCARALGWSPKEAIGKKIYLGSDRPGEVRGVVRDFHYASLHSKVQPLVLFPGGWSSTIMIRTTGKQTNNTLAFLESKWKTFAAHRPFEYRFMDEDFQRLYTSEMRTAKVFSIFSGIAIMLACLGLFGLSAYSAQQRLKEIGVRKVLGASASQIVLLLSGNFLKLVLIAFLIVLPLAWYLSNLWLSDFAYRTNIGVGIFIGSAFLVVAIALLTVSVQSIKAAWTNPVKSLRSE